jgi:error-prone DNA polymerase
MPEKAPSNRPAATGPHAAARRGPGPIHGGSHGGQPGYAELLAASNFSFLRGASHPEELAAASAVLGLAGFAIADRNTLAGAVRGHLAAKQTGMRFAVGCRLVFRDGTPDVAVWAPDRAAYGRLCRLLTTGNLRAEKGQCHLDLADLLEWGQGLELAVIPGLRLDSRLDAVLSTLSDAFPGSTRLGATCLYRGGDARRLAEIAARAGRAGASVVALGDVLYHTPDRRRLQDVLSCVREHRTLDNAGRLLEAHAERHMKDAAEMRRLFHAHPEAVTETLAILERLTFSLDELKYEYPLESAGASATPFDELVRLTFEGARQRYPMGCRRRSRRCLIMNSASSGSSATRPIFSPSGTSCASPAARDPVPGPRLGGQLRRLLLPRRHRGEAGERQPPVRALYLRGARRAPGYRCGLRA